MGVESVLLGGGKQIVGKADSEAVRGHTYLGMVVGINEVVI